MISARSRLVLVLLAPLALVACSEQHAVSAPDPQAILRTIPAADSARYQEVRDMKAWRNPYLIVRPNAIILYDFSDNAEITLKPEELLPALANLPISNWPYGRVVAAAEDETRASEQDAIAVRRNKGIIGGLLHGANIQVKWVPSA